MKIIDQYHKILHMDELDRIELAGRTCYKSEDKIGSCKENCPPYHIECTKCPENSPSLFVRRLIKSGHEAMLEHGGATVRFVTNRSVTHELVRHRLASFGQESTRYVNYSGKEIEFIRPVWCSDSVLGEYGFDSQDFEEKENLDNGEVYFIRGCYDAEVNYKELMSCGWRPEQAREVLPNALKTEIVITANYREWRHILKLRALGTTGKPHPQMQALMLPLLAEFKKECSAIFHDL